MNYRRQDVSINGVSLRGLDSRVIVRAIRETENEAEVNFGNLAGRSGRLPIGQRLRRGKTVEVEFAIRELYDLPARARVLDMVNAWATDGVLQMSSRLDQRLNVYCTARAPGGDLRDYNANYTLTFKTGGIPYWEATSPTTLTVTEAGEHALIIPGTAPTVVDADFTAIGASTSSLTIAVRTGTVTRYFYTGAIEADSSVHWEHTSDGILIGSVSSLTSLSDDDLFAGPGAVYVSVTADGPFTATFGARGRWL